MCIGVPGRLIDVDGWDATVDIGGASRKINVMLLDDAVAGDHVIIHAGYAISKINEVEAAELIRLLGELSSDPPDDLSGQPSGRLAASESLDYLPANDA